MAIEQQDLTALRNIPVNIPGVGLIQGDSVIVLLGPNGSGKSKLAREIARVAGDARMISAQRRTHLSERLQIFPGPEAEQNVINQLQTAQNNPWHLSNEIDILFSRLLADHFEKLAQNDKARKSGASLGPLTDTIIAKLENFWAQIFPGRHLDLATFSPRVTRTLRQGNATYDARGMSDGERSSLYLAARVLTSNPGILIVDEPELHLHSRLATAYWDGLELLRPDIRFVYATHDLGFALSRRLARIIVTRDRDVFEVAPETLPPEWLVEDLLGAATLSISAQRFVFFEGEGLAGSAPKGEAAKFFRAWFNHTDTVPVGVGNSQSVISATKAFKNCGLVRNASIVGIVDSDHYSDDALVRVAESPELWILRVHEFENLLVLPGVLRAIAKHLGIPDDPWTKFRERLLQEFAQVEGRIVGLRARTQFDDLLRGLFTAEALDGSPTEVKSKHMQLILGRDWPKEFEEALNKSAIAASDLLSGTDVDLLRLIPGKGLLGKAASILGVRADRYFEIAVEALRGSNEQLKQLGAELEAALRPFLPPRKATSEASD